MGKSLVRSSVAKGELGWQDLPFFFLQQKNTGDTVSHHSWWWHFDEFLDDVVLILTSSDSAKTCEQSPPLHSNADVPLWEALLCWGLWLPCQEAMDLGSRWEIPKEMGMKIRKTTNNRGVSKPSRPRKRGRFSDIWHCSSDWDVAMWGWSWGSCFYKETFGETTGSDRRFVLWIRNPVHSWKWTWRVS